jgi:hypothetical protein
VKENFSQSFQTNVNFPTLFARMEPTPGQASSSTFADMMQRFGNVEGSTIRFGRAGGGTYTLNGVIYLDPNLLPSSGAVQSQIDFAMTAIAHELSHAVNFQFNPNLQPTAALAISAGLDNEARAWVDEYVVEEEMSAKFPADTIISYGENYEALSCPSFSGHLV